MQVLCYHAITDDTSDDVWGHFAVEPGVLHAQLRLLQRLGVTFLDGSQVVEVLRDGRRPPARSVLVTFDDGYVDYRDEALPILRRLGIPSVLFALSDAAHNHWDVAKGGARRELLDVPALQELAAARDVEVAVHSATHPVLPEVHDRLQEEVEQPLRVMRRTVGALPLFAYPFGAHDPVVREAVSRAGYAGAFTIDRGAVTPSSDTTQLPRFMVTREWGVLGTAVRLATGGRPAPAWVRRTLRR